MNEVLKCGYCGGNADHKHGTGHACGDCCAMHGGFTHYPELKTEYKWVGDMFKSRVALMDENQQLRVLLREAWHVLIISPSCQKGQMDRCCCEKCIKARINAFFNPVPEAVVV